MVLLTLTMMRTELLNSELWNSFKYVVYIYPLNNIMQLATGNNKAGGCAETSL